MTLAMFAIETMDKIYPDNYLILSLKHSSSSRFRVNGAMKSKPQNATCVLSFSPWVFILRNFKIGSDLLQSPHSDAKVCFSELEEVGHV